MRLNKYSAGKVVVAQMKYEQEPYTKCDGGPDFAIVTCCIGLVVLDLLYYSSSVWLLLLDLMSETACIILIVLELQYETYCIRPIV